MTKTDHNSVCKTVEEVEKKFFTHFNFYLTSFVSKNPNLYVLQDCKDMVEYYLRGVKICKNYFETKDLVGTLHNFYNDGFFEEVLVFNKYLSDELDQPDLLHIILMAEDGIQRASNILSYFMEEMEKRKKQVNKT